MNESPSTNSSSDSPASNATLNKLRAAVLGANDGIVSTSSVVMGVAGATTSKMPVITAGLAALVAGALSMAVGEYVSVSSQSDAEKAYIDKEKAELKADPDGEFEELVQAYVDRGVNEKTARQVAKELTEKDVLKAHLETEFNIDADDINNPMHAAVASLLAFTAGGLVPFLAVLLAPEPVAVPVTIVSVVIALVATGYLSATVGGASRLRAITRVIIGGVLAMAITYGVGRLFGASIGA